MNGQNPNNMTPEQRAVYEQKRREYLARKAAYEKRRQAEQQRREVEEAAKRAKMKKVWISVVCVTVAVILIGLSAFLVAKYISDVDPSKPKTFTYRIDDEKERVAYSDAVRGNLVFINMRLLRDALSLTESGSEPTSVKYTSRSTKSSVVFSDGSNIAIVNGMSVKMPAQAKVNADECSVPLDTISYIFTGITISKTASSVRIERTDSVDILAKSTDTLSMVIEFSTDLSDYEQYMNPQGTERDKYLTLVNKENGVGEDYVPENLVSISPGIFEGNASTSGQMDACAEKALYAMVTELRKATGNGYMCVLSGYRTYAYQRNVFDRNMNGMTLEESRTKITDTAYPGYSEHQTGLCADLWDTRYSPTVNPFTDGATATWLQNNAWKFGFILRFPSGKEQSTGYSYESWHFRFVGRYHAQKISAAGITLEEYLETLK